MKEKKNAANLAFMDSEKVYDRVDREAVRQILQIYGISGNVLAGIKSFYEQSSLYVRVAKKLNCCFRSNNGISQE